MFLYWVEHNLPVLLGNCVKLTAMLRDQLKKHFLCFEVLIENSNFLLNNSTIVSLQSCEVTFTIEKILNS